MTVPQANYVIDKEGQKMFVQISVQDWENFVSEFKRLESLQAMKNKLKNAFIEVRQIQNGQKEGTTLTDFLHEL